MSGALKCDRCGTLYEQEKGCVTMEQVEVTGANSSWSADLCAQCSRKLLQFLGPALNDLPVDLRP